jgi:hypothetical protein
MVNERRGLIHGQSRRFLANNNVRRLTTGCGGGDRNAAKQFSKYVQHGNVPSGHVAAIIDHDLANKEELSSLDPYSI